MAENTLNPPEFLSLYVHVPFCQKKCPYCDFFSVTDRSMIAVYVDGVCQEIRLWSAEAGSWSRAIVHTVYFGGGTPSLLSLNQFEQILDTIRHYFCLTASPELTVEINTGTVDAAFLDGLRHLGINRLSIGAQSFDPAKLSCLSRVHTRDQVFNALDSAGRAGFSNLGLDLMYALPRETAAVWQKDLDIALALNLPHLSCYMLTLEPGTLFFDRYEKGLLTPCGPDRRMEFFVQTAQVLENHGYRHYEVSNFALGGKNRSVHNSHYWQRGAYLGAGPSAHSFLPQGLEDGFSRASGPIRSWNEADILAWLTHLAAGRLPWSGHEVLTPAQEMMERVMLGLRTDGGIHTDGLHREIHSLMLRLADQGLGVFLQPREDEQESRRFRLTRSGMTCLDSIVDAFALKIL